jgi:tetratricopeptide (TPR) repeat protein
MEKSIRGLVFLIVGLGLLLLKIPLVFPDQIIIESNDQFDLAHTFMGKGNYTRAVGEFERFIHFFPKDPKVPRARYLIGVCHLKDGRHERARDIFFEIIKSHPEGPFAANAFFLVGESYYQQGVLKEAEHYFAQGAEKSPIPELKNTALYRLGWTKMQGNRWRDASSTFRKVERESTFYESSQYLAEQSLKGESLPYKNPVCAGVLAAIVPGLGHAYVSRYKDATIAFLLNGLFIWAAVESFHEDHEVLGGILAFLELGWYTGNIYSAMNVTHKHNRRMQNQFRRTLKDQLDLHLFVAREGHVGLALTWRF